MTDLTRTLRDIANPAKVCAAPDYETLTLHLCRWNCAPDDKRVRDVRLPCYDESACTCGAARWNRLIFDTRAAAAQLSYYNAGEGDSFSRERAARQRAQRQFDELKSLCAEAGIDWGRGGSYLV